LNNDGLLIFDYWSKPAVLKDPPKEKKKTIKHKNKIIIRSTNFKHLKKRDIIKINFQFLIKENNQVSSFNETHDMRYFSKIKINDYLKFYKFKLINHYKWLDSKSKNWYLCVVAQKIQS
jgi:predicted class III extradiol MEMO1 family dioxygenase